MNRLFREARTDIGLSSCQTHGVESGAVPRNPGIGQQRLQELVYGHPLAVERLRAMQAVIDVAIAAEKCTASAEKEKAEFWLTFGKLRGALREGGFIE